MNRTEPRIETCTFRGGSEMSEANKRTVKHFLIMALLDDFDKKLKSLKQKQHSNH